MKNGYKISNIYDLNSNTLVDKVQKSDFYIQKSGEYRNILNHLSIAIDIRTKVIEITDSIELFSNEINNLLLNKYNEKSLLSFSLDISLINRKNIADILTQIARLCSHYKCDVNILYGLADYKPPSNTFEFNQIVKPVNHFFSGWSNQPGLPVMTVVGLGYEKDKALGAIEYLESSNTIVYLPNSQEERYKFDVLEVNKNVLDMVKKENILDYQVSLPSFSIFSIDSILTSYKASYKIVLFPFGPKIFYASSLVSCIAHPEASVWFVSGEDNDLDSSQDRSIIDCVGFHFEMSENDVL